MELKLLYEFNSQSEFSLSYCDSICINFPDKIFTPIIKMHEGKFTMEIDTNGYVSIYSLLERHRTRNTVNENLIQSLINELKEKIKCDFEHFSEYCLILQNFEIDLNNIFIKESVLSNTNDIFSRIIENLEYIKYVYYPLNGDSNNLYIDYSRINYNNTKTIEHTQTDKEHVVHTPIKIKLPNLKFNFSFLSMLENYLVILVFFIEVVLIIVAFFLYKFQDVFTSPKIPLISIFAIIVACAILDIWVLFSKNSPAKIVIFNKDRINENNIIKKDLSSYEKLKSNSLSHSMSSPKIGVLTATFSGNPGMSNKEKTYILVDDFIVGKSSSNVDFTIVDDSVDDMHARITKNQNSYFIFDLNSKNGTYINEKKLKKGQEVLLKNNSLIRFGSLEYKFSIN